MENSLAISIDGIPFHPAAHEGKDVRSKVRERWLKDLFDGADKDSSGTLDVKEVLSMMHRLNVGVSSKEIKRKFKVCTVALSNSPRGQSASIII